MLKTRLGLPANVVAVVMYLVALMGCANVGSIDFVGSGMTAQMFLSGGAAILAPLVLAGYILLFEELNFVRRAAVKSIALILVAVVVNVVLTLIPDLLAVIEKMLNIFDETMYGDFMRGYGSFTGMMTSMVALAEKVFLVLLAILAVFNKSIDMKCLTKLADK